MSFLIELFIQILIESLGSACISAVCPSTKNAGGWQQNRICLIGLGVFLSILGVILFFYFRSFPPVSIENYQSTEITYSRVYYDKKSDEPKIVLVSENQKYEIYKGVWREQYSAENIVEGLAKSDHSIIWLDSMDSHNVKGVIAPTFFIDPALGVAMATAFRKERFYIVWIVTGIGAFLLILVVFFDFKNKNYELRI